MQRCNNCEQKFSKRQVYKSFWLGYKSFECPNCKSKSEHSFKNRWIGGLCVGLSVFAGGIVQSWVELSFGYEMLLGTLLIIFLLSILSWLSIPYLTFIKPERPN
ncbi:MAG: hypothetical protein KJP26_08180 [Maribacter sp.]|nr:hypothetical protein [Maribacter sp.]